MSYRPLPILNTSDTNGLSGRQSLELPLQEDGEDTVREIGQKHVNDAIATFKQLGRFTYMYTKKRTRVNSHVIHKI